MAGSCRSVLSLADLERFDDLWAVPSGGRPLTGTDPGPDPSELRLDEMSRQLLAGCGLILRRWARAARKPLPACLETAFPLYRLRERLGSLALGTRGLTVHLASETVKEARDLLGTRRLTPLKRYRFETRAWAAAVPAGEPDPVGFARELVQRRPRGVLAVSPVLIWPAEPREDCYEKQWHHHGRDSGGSTSVTSAQTDHAFVEQAWNSCTRPRGRCVRIAIIDEAFKWEHPNLKDAVLPAVSGGFFVTASGTVEFKAGTGGLTPDGAELYHGTRCAGSAAARPSEGCTCSGSAPEADLLLFALGRKVTCESLAEAITCAVEPALYVEDAAPGEGADVLSISYRCPPWVGEVVPPATIEDVHPVLAALRFGARRGRECLGSAVFYAASNSEEALALDIVTRSPDLMVVGRTDDGGKAANAFGPALACVAPGRSIRITTSSNKDGCEYCTPYASGTSYATPLAAGIAALVLGLRPRLPATELRKVLLESCDKVGGVTYDEQGHNSYYGHGRVNALKAVNRALGIPRPIWPLR